jgi:hypothetical protein
MALYFGPVPHGDAQLSEKFGYFAAMVAIVVCFDRISPSRRPATTRDLVMFIALGIVAVGVTISFSFWWHVIGSLWKK